MNKIQQSGLGYALTMLLAGIGISILAALNAGLGVKLQSPAVAASILFFVGLSGSLIYLFVFEDSPSLYSNLRSQYISILVDYLSYSTY